MKYIRNIGQRGGDYYDNGVVFLRSGFRVSNDVGHEYYDLGFRVARELDSELKLQWQLANEG